MKNPALSADLEKPYTARVLEVDEHCILMRSVRKALSRQPRRTTRIRNSRRFAARKVSKLPGYRAFQFHCARNPEMAEAFQVSVPKLPKPKPADLWDSRNIQ